MSSSGSDSVGRSVSMFFVLGGVVFWGTVCFGFGNPFKRLVPARSCFFECVAEVRDSPKFFKILKNIKN
jgi:hypothetical protein